MIPYKTKVWQTPSGPEEVKYIDDKRYLDIYYALLPDTNGNHPCLTYVDLCKAVGYRIDPRILQEFNGNGIFLRSNGYCLIYPWEEWDGKTKETRRI
jgi:hypothetical protein